MTILERNLAQVKIALTDRTNLHATMVARSCNEVELLRHPDWAIIHFAENGGAKAFAEEVETASEPEYYI